MYVTEWITQKWNGSRSFLEGKPSIVIHRGELIRETMKKNKLDINQLQHLLRSANAFTVAEVEYAVLETDGTLSVLKKADYQTPTRKDMNLPPTPTRLPMTLIMDGQLIQDNLDELGRNKKWLLQKMKEKGFIKIEDAFYAEWTTEENLIIQDGKGLNKD